MDLIGVTLPSFIPLLLMGVPEGTHAGLLVLVGRDDAKPLPALATARAGC